MGYKWNITHDTTQAANARHANPGMGYCGRCGMPWNMVKHHTTWHSADSHQGRAGCFPLCQSCWEILGAPEARIEYYRDLVQGWAENGAPVSEDTKHDIMRAVANGG